MNSADVDFIESWEVEAYRKGLIDQGGVSAAIENKIAPPGTIIVKENMNIDKKVVKITVMAKVEGYNPEGGDWFWAAYSPEGEVLVEGVPGGCFNCHMGMKSNDYIIVRPLDL